MKVYGYCRVSTAEQANGGLSLDTQRQQITGYAMMKGWSVAEFYRRNHGRRPSLRPSPLLNNIYLSIWRTTGTDARPDAEGSGGLEVEHRLDPR